MDSEERKKWWKVEGRAYEKKDGTLVLELKHPTEEYSRHKPREKVK